MKTTFLLGSTLALLLVGSIASAETVNLRADMLDPNGGNGTGTAELTFDDVTNTLCGKITYQGLSGAVTKAHIHDSTVENQTDPKSHIADLVAAGSPMPVQLTLNADQKAKIIDQGIAYINLHTAAAPDGEIAGEILAAPEGQAPQACPAAPDGGAPTDAGAGDAAPPQPAAPPDAGHSASPTSAGGDSNPADSTHPVATSPSDGKGASKGGCSAASMPTSSEALGASALAIAAMAFLGRSRRRR